MCERESSKEKELFTGLPANFAGKEHGSYMPLVSFGKGPSSRL